MIAKAEFRRGRVDYNFVCLYVMCITLARLYDRKDVKEEEEKLNNFKLFNIMPMLTVLSFTHLSSRP